MYAADQTDKSTATRMVCLLHPIPKHSKFEFFLRSESLLLNLITISYPKTMLTFDNWLEWLFCDFNSDNDDPVFWLEEDIWKAQWKPSWFEWELESQQMLAASNVQKAFCGKLRKHLKRQSGEKLNKCNEWQEMLMFKRQQMLSAANCQSNNEALFAVNQIPV